MSARDEILGSFLDGLDQLAGALIFEFNKLHASGQGLHGYTEITSEFSVDDAALALDQAGLPFAPINGSLQVLVRNKQTGLTQTTDIYVPLNGLDADLTLDRLRGLLDDVDGIHAEITPARRLTVRAGRVRSRGGKP